MKEERIVKQMPSVFVTEVMPPFTKRNVEYAIRFKPEEMPVTSTDFRYDKLFVRYCNQLLPENPDEKQLHQIPDEVGRQLFVEGSRVAGYLIFTQDDPRLSTVAKNNELLLQPDGDNVENSRKSAMMWGDCGVANFFIDTKKN